MNRITPLLVNQNLGIQSIKPTKSARPSYPAARPSATWGGYKNFGIEPAKDIRFVKLKDIPSHDILCAGFPCQPFSKAGGQQVLKCPQWGDLIDFVVPILRYHKPGYFIVENVPNLVRHNKGKTWADIKKKLQKAGYDVDDHKLSPHQFGIPQIRERAFIVGKRNTLNGFEWPVPPCPDEISIRTVLDSNPHDARKLAEPFVKYLEAWQVLLRHFPKDEELPSFPIWSMEFGATYPYIGQAPYATRFEGYDRWRGSFGHPLRGLGAEEVKEALPPYARENSNVFPDWKIDFISKNRNLSTTLRHRRFLFTDSFLLLWKWRVG